MLTSQALYTCLASDVDAAVLACPGTLPDAETRAEARRLLVSPVIDVAETALLRHEPRPQPDPLYTDQEADVAEPIP